MQRLRHDVDWIRWTPVLALAVSGIALTPCRTQAQTQTKAQTQPRDNKTVQKEEPPKAATDRRTVQQGGFTLKLVDPDRGQGVQVGGQFGGRPFQSNASFYLDISAADPDDLLLIQGVEDLHGVDDKGRPALGPSGPHPPFLGSRFGAPEGLRREGLPLQVENGATSLKTLEGNLILDAGAVRTLTFAGDDMRFDASKKITGGTVTLDFFKQYNDNEVRVLFTWVYPRITQPLDPGGVRRPVFYNNERFVVEIIGTDGVTYKNGSRGQTSHEDRPKGLPPDPANGIPVATMMIAHIDCGFQQLPDGVHVKSIICRVVEQGAGIRSVPFKFTDVPLTGRGL